MRTQEFDTQPRLQDPLFNQTAAHSSEKDANPAGSVDRSSKAQSILQLQRTHGNRYVQRMLALSRKDDGAFDAGPEVESAIQQTRGNGQALDSGVRTQMETAIGADFSGVRVHANTEADTLNRAVNARAFTTGKDIFFRDGEYSPGSSGGQKLLAHELTHVVQQTGGIRTKLMVGAPGDVHEQEADRVAEHVMNVQRFSATDKASPVAEGPKIGSGPQAVSRAVDNVSSAHTVSSGPSAAKAPPVQIVIGTVSIVPASSATGSAESEPGEDFKPGADQSAQKDPRFQKVLNNLETSAKNTKKHPAVAKKVREAQIKAAKPPSERRAAAQLIKMKMVRTAETREVAPESFLDVLSKAIDEAMPKGSDNAENFLEGGKQESLKGTMTGQFNRQKQEATRPLTNARNKNLDFQPVQEADLAPLQNRDLANDSDKKLPPDPVLSLPPDVGAAEAMPQPKPDAQVSLEKNKQEVNQALADRKMTEDQLQEAHDPRFSRVLTAKTDVERNADSAPARYRASEKVVLANAVGRARGDEKQGLLTFASQRAHSKMAVQGHQSTAAKDDTAARQKTVNDIEEKYNNVESEVKKQLDPLDTQVPQMFDGGVTRAIRNMKTNISVNLDRYKAERHKGFWGRTYRAAKDYWFTLDDDRVKKIYQDGRNVFKHWMVDITFKEIIKFVEDRLQAARKAITDGEKSIDDYIKDTKDPELRKVAELARKDISGRFAELRRGVENKKNNLAQKLAQSYKDATEKARVALEEIRKENRGKLNKCIDYIEEAYEILCEIKDKLLNILKKGLEVIELIIKHPIRFVENLIEAVSQGFNKFRDRAGEYLEEALLEWLVGPLGEARITLPKDLSPGSILSLVLQVLGLDLASLRQKVNQYALVHKLPSPEAVFEVLKTLWEGGPAALWEQFVEYLGNLKDQVIGAIKDWLIAQIVKEGIKALLLMFSFAGGIIQAARTIYSIVMFFVDNWHTIEKVVSAIFGSIADIANGQVSAASDRIVQAIRWAIRLVINFLARLLHLTGISDAVIGFINKIRTKVHNAVDSVIAKVFGGIGKMLGGERANRLLERLAGGSPEERLAKAMTAALAAVNRFAGKRVGAIVLRPLLTAIKFRYQLRVLDVIPRGDRWAVRGIVNPEDVQLTDAQVGGDGGSSTPLKEGDLIQLRGPSGGRRNPVYKITGITQTHFNYELHKTSRSKTPLQSGMTLLSSFDSMWVRYTPEANELEPEQLKIENARTWWSKYYIANRVLNHRHHIHQFNPDNKDWEHIVEQRSIHKDDKRMHSVENLALTSTILNQGVLKQWFEKPQPFAPGFPDTGRLSVVEYLRSTNASWEEHRRWKIRLYENLGIKLTPVTTDQGTYWILE